jgi:hypothetical protein
MAPTWASIRAIVQQLRCWGGDGHPKPPQRSRIIAAWISHKTCLGIRLQMPFLL